LGNLCGDRFDAPKVSVQFDDDPYGFRGRISRLVRVCIEEPKALGEERGSREKKEEDEQRAHEANDAATVSR
jgi:hypothetical protein